MRQIGSLSESILRCKTFKNHLISHVHCETVQEKIKSIGGPVDRSIWVARSSCLLPYDQYLHIFWKYLEISKKKCFLVGFLPMSCLQVAPRQVRECWNVQVIIGNASRLRKTQFELSDHNVGVTREYGGEVGSIIITISITLGKGINLDRFLVARFTLLLIFACFFNNSDFLEAIYPNILLKFTEHPQAASGGSKRLSSRLPQSAKG